MKKGASNTLVSCTWLFTEAFLGCEIEEIAQHISTQLGAKHFIITPQHYLKSKAQQILVKNSIYWIRESNCFLTRDFMVSPNSENI